MPLALNAGLVIAAAVSWRDDVTPLAPAIRLPLHFLAAACLVLALPGDARIFQGLLPLALDRALGVLLLAGFMNFFNFMDGINGLAGSEAVAIAGGYLLLTITTIGLAYAPLAAALLGASIGFLVWNLREKALVFLGDVGSVPLGLLTGALMIDLAVNGYWPAALILPSYFLADAALTLAKRLLRGEKSLGSAQVACLSAHGAGIRRAFARGLAGCCRQHQPHRGGAVECGSAVARPRRRRRCSRPAFWMLARARTRE